MGFSGTGRHQERGANARNWKENEIVDLSSINLYKMETMLEKNEKRDLISLTAVYFFSR
jgi:hypothetical protein